MSDHTLLIQFSRDVEPDGEVARAVLAVSGVRVRHWIDLVPGLVTVEMEPRLLASAVNILSMMPGVEGVERDPILELAAVPNDTLYPQQWWCNAIRLPQAWDVRTDASAITVAVMDTGVNYLHPELASNFWTNPNEISGNALGSV